MKNVPLEEKFDYFRSQPWFNTLKTHIKAKNDDEVLDYLKKIHKKIHNEYIIFTELSLSSETLKGTSFWVREYQKYNSWLTLKQAEKSIKDVFSYLNSQHWFSSFKKNSYKFNHYCSINELISNYPDDFLGKSFRWCDTKEGFTFWDEIAHSYNKWFYSE